MLNKIPSAAKKALLLDQDGVIKLLVIMAALLCWIMSITAGSTLILNQFYTQWQLDRQGEISVYLLADTPNSEISNLTTILTSITEVESVKVLKKQDVKFLIAPYFQNDDFPLPIIIDVRVGKNLNRKELENKIYDSLPTAEIDDAQEILTTVASMVRLAQIGGVILGAVVLLIMGLLVMLTVRAGLRGQQRCLSILQFLGGTDEFLSSLVVRQVAVKSLLGWGIASVISLITFVILALYFSALQALLFSGSGASIWAGIILVPLIVPIVAILAAIFTAKNVIKGRV